MLLYTPPVRSSSNFCWLTAVWLAVFLLVGPRLASAQPYPRKTPVVMAVERVSPAVVNISSEQKIRKRFNPFSGFGMDPFFDSFFKDFFDPGFEQRAQRSSLGSGVIIDGERGFILTNAHVITSTGKITIILKDEREFEAQIVGADPDSDLAVLRIETESKLPAIEMGDSSDLFIGETVIAIGNPFGFSNTVTTGVISATNRSIRAKDRIYHDFIQIDASVNPGNSGGPLLNINGDLIGINTAIYAKAQGIGFAIPINKAKRIINDLIRYGEVVQAWVGVTVQNITPELAEYLKIDPAAGVIVKAVESESPAAAAGIKEGDLILKVAQTPTPSQTVFKRVMKGFAAGDTIQLTLRRDDDEQRVEVLSKIFPLERALALAQRLLGITVTPRVVEQHGQTPSPTLAGVMIEDVSRHAYLAQIGVRPGDVIRQIDDVTIHDLEDFKKAVIKFRHKKTLVVLVQRGDQGYYISVKL